MMCLYFFVLKVRFFTVKKLKMKSAKSITFEEGCSKYLEYCRQRNLRQGNVVSLSQLLGHSSLEITQNYIHLLVSDVAKQVDEFNVLDKFYSRNHISLRSKS